MSNELTLGGTTNEAIAFAMNNYQRSKQNAADAEDVATEKEHSLLRKDELDMLYWHERLIAAGAMSLEIAAPPNPDGTVAGQPIDMEKYKDGMQEARISVWKLEQFHGLPFAEPQ